MALDVLLIDDNEDHVKILLWAFGQSEIENEVTVFGDGENARRYLSDPAKLPDLVILDVNLPKVNGLELLENIRKDVKLRSLPIVMLSSSDRIEDVVKAYALGANTYISKSAVFNEIGKAVDTLCVYWSDIAKLPTKMKE